MRKSLSPSLYEEIPYAYRIYIGLILLNIMLKTHVKCLSNVSFSTKNSLFSSYFERVDSLKQLG